MAYYGVSDPTDEQFERMINELFYPEKVSLYTDSGYDINSYLLSVRNSKDVRRAMDIIFKSGLISKTTFEIILRNMGEGSHHLFKWRELGISWKSPIEVSVEAEEDDNGELYYAIYIHRTF